MGEFNSLVGRARYVLLPPMDPDQGFVAPAQPWNSPRNSFFVRFDLLREMDEAASTAW